MFQSLQRIYMLGIGILVVIIVLVIISILHPKPPVYQIHLSRKALARANKADAKYYASDTFQAAQQNWQKLLTRWRQENQKAFYRRNYAPLKQLAKRTQQLAEQSERQAIRARDSLKNVARIELTLLMDRLGEYKAQFDQMPIDEALRKNAIKGEMLVLEGKAALERGQIKQALHQFKMAEKLIGQSGKNTKEMLDNYLSNLPMWRRWAQETIAESKSNQSTALIVDKFNRTLYVYDRGELIHKYSIELGKNWMGHKRQRGDNATPEGHYLIIRKIGKGNSKYHKALVLNYPNQRDLQEFLNAKKTGQLPKNAQIGGSIEIHGDGGKGINWTQGCIALTNNDIDELFDRVELNTPVTIVGALNGLNNKSDNTQRNVHR